MHRRPLELPPRTAPAYVDGNHVLRQRRKPFPAIFNVSITASDVFLETAKLRNPCVQNSTYGSAIAMHPLLLISSRPGSLLRRRQEEPSDSKGVGYNSSRIVLAVENINCFIPNANKAPKPRM